MYKYQIIGNEIIDLLKQRKKLGEKTVILTARQIEKMFDVSSRCGGEPGTRYPLICQAMEYASNKYPSKWIDGKKPSTTFTVEYELG